MSAGGNGNGNGGRVVRVPPQAFETLAKTRWRCHRRT